MAEIKKGTIVSISSLATLYPLPYMALYNAGKSALSSFTQSMMLEHSKYPRWIDYRLGDICTDFNESAPKQDSKIQSEIMKSAWHQIEKQLKESPTPQFAAKRLINYINHGRDGLLYGGSFFQARLAPFFYRFLNSSSLQKVLKLRYK